MMYRVITIVYTRRKLSALEIKEQIREKYGYDIIDALNKVKTQLINVKLKYLRIIHLYILLNKRNLFISYICNQIQKFIII